MINLGAKAPDFTSKDQFGRPFRLTNALQSCDGDVCVPRNALLLFYPRDWTPTCSIEIPALNKMAQQYLDEANTTVVAINADHRYSHARWAESLGGVTIPILEDSHPYGAISRAYGAWLPDGSVSDRATVVVAPNGKVVYSKSVGEFGQRNMFDLLQEVKRAVGVRSAPVAQARIGGGAPAVAPSGDTRPLMFVSQFCGACAPVKQYLRAKGIEAQFTIVDPAASPQIASQYKIDRTPMMILGGKYYRGATPIIEALVPTYGR